MSSLVPQIKSPFLLDVIKSLFVLFATAFGVLLHRPVQERLFRENASPEERALPRDVGIRIFFGFIIGLFLYYKVFIPVFCVICDRLIN